MTSKYVQKIMKQYNLPRLGRGARCGELNPEWKGGVTIDKYGYKLVRVYGHPFARKIGYVSEHRLIMEKHLGRFLLPHEVVHHKNDDKLDNRVENLELFSNNGEHLKKTLKGKIPKWTPEGFQKMQENGHRVKVHLLSYNQKS
jgi:hypothetical protein